MSVSDGQSANATNFNNAFVSKTSDSTITGKVTLKRTSSGDQVTDVQAAILARASGPESSTDNAVARFDSTTGKVIQNSGVTIDDSNNVTIPGTLTVGGVASAIIQQVKTTVTYSDLSTAAKTNSIELVQLSAGDLLLGLVLKHSEVFSGGSISGYTVSVGITGELDRHIQAFNVFQAIGDSVYAASNIIEVPSFASDTSLKIAATSTGDDLDEATAGSVDVWIIKVNLS